MIPQSCFPFLTCSPCPNSPFQYVAWLRDQPQIEALNPPRPVDPEKELTPKLEEPPSHSEPQGLNLNLHDSVEVKLQASLSKECCEQSKEEKKKKKFKKDIKCPVKRCHRKYSSRIALRAHLRNDHPHWAEETSDYEP